MYEMLADLLVDEFGVDRDNVTEDATFRALELDSLSLAELAVIVADRTGMTVDDVSPDTTLGEAAGRIITVADAADRA